MHARMLSVVVLHVVFFIRTEYELYGCDALSDPNYGLIQITGLRSYYMLCFVGAQRPARGSREAASCSYSVVAETMKCLST